MGRGEGALAEEGRGGNGADKMARQSPEPALGTSPLPPAPGRSAARRVASTGLPGVWGERGLPSRGPL